MTPLELWLAAFGLWGLGLYGLLNTRHLVKIILALQLLTKGVLLAVVGAGWVAGQLPLAQTLAITIIVADTLVAVIGLALALRCKQLHGTFDLSALATLKG